MLFPGRRGASLGAGQALARSTPGHTFILLLLRARGHIAGVCVSVDVLFSLLALLLPQLLLLLEKHLCVD